MSPTPRIAVLGGTGFIGRALAARYAAAGADVLLLARKAPTDPLPGRFTAVDLAATEPAELTALLDGERIELVVNAAGGMWGLTDEQMYAANVVMAERLVEAIAGMAVPARLVHIGSVHEYGFAPVGVSQREGDTPAPVMAYGELKLKATRAVVEAAAAGRLTGTVLRLGNVTGAGQPGHSLLGVMAAKLAEAHRSGTTAELQLAPLTALRDFVDLDDCVDAVVAAGTAHELPPIVNIGAGRATTAREMVELLIAASGVPVEITETVPEGGVTPETEWQQLDIALASKALDWHPHRSHLDSAAALWQAVLAQQ